MFDQMKCSEQVYEGQSPSKTKLGQMPNVTGMPVKQREETMPHLPTPRRAAMESARQKMKSL